VKTISATDAKKVWLTNERNKRWTHCNFTKNGKVAAYLTPSQNDEGHPLSEAQFDDMLNSYAAGKITRRNVEETTGLWFK
jgi:hypothetical protein